MSVTPASSAILIVDDSPDRALWTAAFKSAGFPTVEAGESVQAIELLRSGPTIDLLVTTLLQDGSGAQLVVDAVQHRPNLAVIIIACAGHPVGIQKGCFALLLQPVSAAELLNTAHTLLSVPE
jgi:DNA-binding NtrC family response regulator